MPNQHEILSKYIEGLSKNYATSLIAVSSAGTGKTETTMETLKGLGYQENIHYRYVSNYITPVELYLLLAEINQLKAPKILVLDDVEDTLRNPRAIGLLKGALWAVGGKRKVMWNSGTYKVKDKEFEFTGKIIFLLNQLNQKLPIVRALADRGLFYQMDLTKDEILSLMSERIKKDFKDIPLTQKEKIVNLLKTKSELSLRDLPKAINLMRLSPNHYSHLILQK